MTLDAKALDALLELWARWAEGDAVHLRRLGYPDATSEHKFARRAGVFAVAAGAPPEPAGGDPGPGFESEEAAEAVDRAMAGLLGQRPLLFHALRLKYVRRGTDVGRARELGVKPGAYVAMVQRGRMYVKAALEATMAVPARL